MSDLFMNMHHRRQRWHSHKNTPPTSTSETTATTTSESPSSTQHVNDHIFSHNKKSFTTDGEDAAPYANLNFKNRKEAEDDKHEDKADGDDAFANILSLKLRKPKHWKWELSTSKSCSNIALPRILLYDHKGQLLVDAQEDQEAVYKQQDSDNPKRDKSKKRTHQSNYQQRSATTNLTHSIRKALEKEFNDLHIEEATPSPKSNSPKPVTSHSSSKSIDFNTNDLPDYSLSRRSSSLRGVRFNVDKIADGMCTESHIPEFLPTPPSTTTPTSSSSGPREKRKYRRSQSSGRSSAQSESILERFSYQKGRFSSPEYAEEQEVANDRPRYFLRTCNAGTLVVKEDSFNLHPRRRRRPQKYYSSESFQSMKTNPLSSFVALKKHAYRSPTPSDINFNRKQQALCRHLSDRNILANKQLSTSEEDSAAEGLNPRKESVNDRSLRKYSQSRDQTKADLSYSTDVHQNGKVR